MNIKLKKREIAFVAVVICVVMAVIDGVLMVNYFAKSAIKLALFLAVPLVYSLLRKNTDVGTFFKADKRSMRMALALCIPMYFIILGGYLIFRNIFDFSGITRSLTDNIGVSKENFLFVSLYISFVNSLLEEFFFRGFCFLTFKNHVAEGEASMFSALLFALYHVAMMIGWFSVSVFAITLAGLFVGGVIFNYLDKRAGTLYPSWFVHMFANFAINTIGFMLFGII